METTKYEFIVNVIGGILLLFILGLVITIPFAFMGFLMLATVNVLGGLVVINYFNSFIIGALSTLLLGVFIR